MTITVKILAFLEDVSAVGDRKHANNTNIKLHVVRRTVEKMNGHSDTTKARVSH